MEKFSEKVKELRNKMGWAQEDLAREIEVSLSTVQRWEGKGANPARHSRRVLARLLREAGTRNPDLLNTEYKLLRRIVTRLLPDILETFFSSPLIA